MQGTLSSPLSGPTPPLKTQKNRTRMTSSYSLLMTVDDAPRHDVSLLLADLSARVGCNNKNRERAMGKHGAGDFTNNGENVINLCEENNLIVGGNLITHRNINNSPGHHLTGEVRARLIKSSSMTNEMSLFKM